AWGVGVELKFFFMRYNGVGIEGWAVDANQARQDIFVDFSDNIFQSSVHRERNAIGADLGTLTLRYPIHCTRFSPYIFGGGGAIFGGGQRDTFTDSENPDVLTNFHSGSETRAIGQVGGGMKVRLTPHIGWVSDFSWNFVDGPHYYF